MALINLIAVGHMENVFKINKKSITMDSLNLENNRYIRIPKDCDIIDLKSIQFKNPSNDFNYNFISILIGGTEILRLNKDLCKTFFDNKFQNFENINIIDNDRILSYNLPWNELKLKNVIKLIGLQFHEVEIYVSYNGSCECSTVSYYKTFLDNNARRDIVQNNIDIQIEQLMSQNISHSDNNAKHRLLFNGISSGLFINNIDINKINNFNILLNEHSFINLNKYNIKHFVREIDDKCFYLPFGDNLDFNNNDYNSSVNFSRLDSITIELNYNLEDNEFLNFTIGTKLLNIFRTSSGMSGLAFSLIDTHMEDFKKNIFTRLNKKILGDPYCAINCSDIEENQEYLNCSTCHKNFLFEVTRQWIEQRKKCPHCIQPWNNFIIYKNINE